MPTELWDSLWNDREEQVGLSETCAIFRERQQGRLGRNKHRRTEEKGLLNSVTLNTGPCACPRHCAAASTKPHKKWSRPTVRFLTQNNVALAETVHLLLSCKRLKKKKMHLSRSPSCSFHLLSSQRTLTILSALFSLDNAFFQVVEKLVVWFALPKLSVLLMEFQKATAIQLMEETLSKRQNGMGN